MGAGQKFYKTNPRRRRKGGVERRVPAMLLTFAATRAVAVVSNLPTLALSILAIPTAALATLTAKTAANPFLNPPTPLNNATTHHFPLPRFTCLTSSLSGR
ncbi:hypothetical protein Pisl_0289 [Pyrobaculum islandicum DSM 4184]|uniref:Uncharacterized protein n=1 Tax=Pyrobaculum islandicum (strain DSM 4184 / JCM 9189 / GEO3) TaxID=384616 RepID=A1RR86_PYRIL|nr:hypothetical protein Pisl_0289 [Pyrobaculum islandicum DSM 4184]